MSRTNTRSALILNELTLSGISAEDHVEYARRIGAEWCEDRDYDVLGKRYSYLTRWAQINFGAKTLPVLTAMGKALDEGRGV